MAQIIIRGTRPKASISGCCEIGCYRQSRLMPNNRNKGCKKANDKSRRSLHKSVPSSRSLLRQDER